MLVYNKYMTLIKLVTPTIVLLGGLSDCNSFDMSSLVTCDNSTIYQTLCYIVSHKIIGNVGAFKSISP